MQGDALSLDEKPPMKAPAGKIMPTRADGRDGKRREPGERDMGDALRSVYDKTVQEAVPDEFLDLLSKLD